MAKTTIQVSDETKTLLFEYGKFGETYDQLLIRLLKELKERRNGSRKIPKGSVK